MAAGAADVVVRVRVLDQPPGPRSRRPQRVGFGALRALAALPAVLGGVLVALVVSGFSWVGSVLFLAWLSVGAALLTVWGERLAVRRMCRFRTSSQAERQLLGPVAMMAMVRCGLPAGTVDWYVQPAPDINACAAGRRSVAVTDGALRSFVSGRLPADQLMAMLVHELGHHETRAARYALTTTWLAAPGRAAFRLVLRVSLALCGSRRPALVTCVLAMVGGGMALVQLVQRQQWVPAAMLAGVGLALLVTPVVHGAVSRASEYAADTYARRVGVGPELAHALMTGQRATQVPRTVWSSLLDRHPPLDRRVELLLRPVVMSRATVPPLPPGPSGRWLRVVAARTRTSLPERCAIELSELDTALSTGAAHREAG